MASKVKALVLAVLLLCLLPAAAFSQSKACSQRSMILALSDRLLADLDSGNADIARYYGRDAAYLKMHYGQMSDADIDAMLANLVKKQANAALGFAYAYDISRHGFEAATAKLDAAQSAFFDKNPYDLTLIRALTLAGRYDLVIDNLKRTDWSKTGPYTLPVALPLVDFPPTDKKRFADIADKAKLTFLAGGLYASLSSYEDWPGFLKRNFDDAEFNGTRGYFVAFSGYDPANPPLPDPRNTLNGKLYRQWIQRVVAASWLAPQSALLYAFALRDRFEPIFAKRAAAKLKQAYDRGELRPQGPMDTGWLMTLRALADVSGKPDRVVKRMQDVPIASRHYLVANAGAVLDTMLAAEAIAPWLKGEIPAFPVMPALASDALKAHWADWRTLAEAIKSGGDPGELVTNNATRGMAADLVYAKGDDTKLLALIAAENDPVLRQRLEADFMSRYDRLCDGSLYFPGDALFLRNTTIHRFAAPKQ